MPTVLRQDGFDIMIYTNDHPPAHVHVWKAGHVVLIDLGNGSTAPSIRENKRMPASDVRKVLNIVGEHQKYLIEKWDDIHG
jgi:hypothetical protein